GGGNITKILAALQDDTLDVFVLDNTIVDHITISVEYCCVVPPWPIMPTNVQDNGAQMELPAPGASPNPFDESTALSFTLPNATSVQLTIYDNYGNRVLTFDLGPRGAGAHSVRWDGNDAAG